LQSFASNERHVAIQHQCSSGLQRRQCLLYRVPGAQLRLLLDVKQIVPLQRLSHLIATMSIDDYDAPWVQSSGGLHHMTQQRLAAQPMQDLGQCGEHACPLPGGEDDNVEAHGWLWMVCERLERCTELWHIVRARSGVLACAYSLQQRGWLAWA
jgi:hypothetical protein